mgnify:CR=1 FL=1
MVHDFANVGAGPPGFLPAGSLDLGPPLNSEGPVEPHAFQMGPGNLVVKNKRPTEALRLGPVSGRIHKGGKVLIRDRGLVHEKALKPYSVDWPFSVSTPALGPLSAHRELSLFDEGHAFI